MHYRRLGRAGLKVEENLKAIALTPKLTPEVLARIDELTLALAR